MKNLFFLGALCSLISCASVEPSGATMEGQSDSVSEASVTSTGESEELSADGEIGGEADSGDPGQQDARGRNDDVAGSVPDSVDDADTEAVDEFGIIPLESAFALTGLSAPVTVVFTEGHVPHIYGVNRLDVQRALGFVVAQDRYFTMDLARRLGGGTLTELVGDAGLDFDMESKLHGTGDVAQRLQEQSSAEMQTLVSAFADGVNAYVEMVGAGGAPAPSEYVVAGSLLGGDTPSDVMTLFTPEDVYRIVSYVLYNTSFETTDVKREEALGKLLERFSSVSNTSEGWEQAVIQDIAEEVRPLFPIASSPLETIMMFVRGHHLSSFHGQGWMPESPGMEDGLLSRVGNALQSTHLNLLRGDSGSFGSNAWAVDGNSSASGGALFAGDGHLALGVPSILYQVGVDTSFLGGGDTSQIGLLIPGFPLLNLLTNGKVVWGQTQLMGDITDWYSESVKLGTDGKVVSTLFESEWRPVERIDETEVIASVDALGSVGGVLSWQRVLTFDGRRLVDVEGDPVEFSTLDDLPEGVFWGVSGPIIPADVNGDGSIDGVSFDYAGLDIGPFLDTLDKMGHSNSVEEFQNATRGLVGYSQNLVVADVHGDIFHTGYQAVPCRNNLLRDSDGTWAEGADPTRLLDGATYGSFEIPLTKDGVVDENHPEHCVVPFGASPQTISPEQGFVHSSNNDPGGMSFDGNLYNEAFYYGGPWDVGGRANTIEKALQDFVAEGGASLEEMMTLQGDTHSVLGCQYVPLLLPVLSQGATSSTTSVSEIWTQRNEALSEVMERLTEWQLAGCPASSGVTTTYNQATPDSRRAAVATMIFNAWLPRLVQSVFNDEALPGVWRTNSSWGKARTLLWMLESVGENVRGLASYDPERGESLFFDDLSTEEIETSEQLIHSSLDAALQFLESDPISKWEGGFGTGEMEEWLWGLRHVVRFESLLLDLLGDSPEFALLAAPFSITQSVLPTAVEGGEDLTGIPWFPRPGDNLSVDAANGGLSGTSFSYGSGPVMRMVVEFTENGVEGFNVIPGGQSGIKESAYFADQASLWLANEALPIRFSVEQVLEGALGRMDLFPGEMNQKIEE